jgi:acetolactate synthase I/II/III large subunit
VTVDASAGTQSFEQAAEGLLALFLALGSEKAFVNPGTDIFPFQEAWASRKERALPSPDPVICTHEFTAVAAAHGYFLMTGKPQSVFVHVDAGTLNAGGAISNAHGDQAGIVFCAGRAPYTCDGQMPGGKDVYIQWGQERLDQAKILQEYVKWHYELALVENLSSTAMRAFQMAANPPAGPVYLTFAREVLMQPAPAVRMPQPRDLTPAQPAAADPDSIARAAEILVAAKRPLIVAGRNGRNPATIPEVAGLAELLGAEIADTYECASAPGDHPLYVGPRIDEILPLADAVLFIDTKVPYIPCQERPASAAAVIFLERDPIHENFVNWSYPADLRITADSLLGLRALRAAVADLQSQGQRAAARARAEIVAAEQRAWRLMVAARARSQASAFPIHPEWLMWSLKQALPRDAIVLEDVVTNRHLARVHMTPDEPKSLFTPGGSCLGWGVNTAIGCKLGAPERMVVSLMGDGGFTFANPVAALWTAIKAGAPSLTVVFNNAGYNAAQMPIAGLYPGGAVARARDGMVTKIAPPPDYAAVANACGALGITLTDPAAVGSTLARAVDEVQHGRCVVIDAILAPI